MVNEKATTQEAPVIVDMTAARTFELLPTDRLFLASISAWKLGKSKASGGNSVHYELTVVEPEEYQGRQAAREDVSLENEWTLGRIKTLLLACGYPKDQVEVKRFAIPTEDDMVGRQCTVALKLVKDPDGRFPDKTVVARWMPREQFAISSEA